MLWAKSFRTYLSFLAKTLARISKRKKKVLNREGKKNQRMNGLNRNSISKHISFSIGFKILVKSEKTSHESLKILFITCPHFERIFYYRNNVSLPVWGTLCKENENTTFHRRAGQHSLLQAGMAITRLWSFSSEEELTWTIRPKWVFYCY